MMSKEFSDALEALRLAGNALLSLSDTIEKVLTETEAKKAEQSQAEETVVSVTMADVKKVLTAKSRAGHTKEVKALLKKYGSDKLSGIDESCYQALMEEAEGIGNA